MPRQNRVTPFGEIIATHHKGALMGNRGCLHDAGGTIQRPWETRRWVTCVPQWPGVRRQLMAPGKYTELFFLDEATAIAAGHRPCSDCRRADYNRFKVLFAASQAPKGVEIRRAEDMDRVLHPERTSVQRPHVSPPSLPDGAMIEIDGRAWLKRGAIALLWTAGGYEDRVSLPPSAGLITPPSSVAVLEAGYPVATHASAR